MNTIRKGTGKPACQNQPLRHACLGLLALTVLFVLPACDSGGNGGNGNGVGTQGSNSDAGGYGSSGHGGDDYSGDYIDHDIDPEEYI